MADKNLLEQMLEHLVNEDQEKAEELFHQYVVEKSREIYENLIEEEVDENLDEESKDEDDDEDETVEEAAKSDDDEDEDEDEVDESIEELDVEDLDEADPTDELAGDISDEMGGEEGDDMDMDDMEGEEKEEEELFQDLDDIVDQLQAKFDELKSQEDDEGEVEMGDEEGEEDEEMKDEFDAELATVREYVEKITGGHGAEKKGAGETAGTGTSSIVAGKNDMGGTAGNLNQGEEAKGGSDSGLTNSKPQDMNTGNINKVGGSKESERMQKDSGGHGAEKSGSSESADNKDSIFRGRR